MRKLVFLFIIIILFCTSSVVAQRTLWQKDWYMGDGELSVGPEWDCQYWKAESLNTNNHYISCMAKTVNYSAWVRHPLDNGPNVCPFSRKMPVDFDKDGDLDVLGFKQQGPLVFWSNEGDWVFKESTLVNMHGGAKNDVHQADIDFDGDWDILTASHEGAEIVVNNDSTFERLVIDGANVYHKVDVVRLTDTSHMAIFVDTRAAPFKGNTHVLVIQDDFSFEQTYLYVPPRPEGWRALIADFNQDGYPDWAQDYGGNVRVLINRGGFECNAFENIFTAHVNTDGLFLQDFDTDGDIDVCTSTINAFYIARNLLMETGSCSFRWEAIGNAPSLGDGVQYVDIDLDGVCDIISSWGYIGYLRYYGGRLTPYNVYNPGGLLNSHWIIADNFDGGDCDVDLEILASWNNNVAIFENQMSTYIANGFLESSVLDIPDNTLPTVFGWGDCVPDGFRIDYFTRAGGSVNECTTSTWVPIDSSGDSIYAVCGGYLQYRLEFHRMEGFEDESPRVDSVFVVIDECPPRCTTTVDSVWFWEDTLCNDSNIVTICYNLTCDTADVNIEMSADGGTTWDVPLNTLIDTAGDIGLDVFPGQHCFKWVMSEDYFGHEHCQFAVRVTAKSWMKHFCTVVDTIDVASLPNALPDRLGPQGLTVGDSLIFFSYKQPGKIGVINSARDSIVKIFWTPNYPWEGWEDLAYDGEYLYGVEAYFDAFQIYKIDPEYGFIVDTSATFHDRRGDGLTYDPDRDCLWLTGHGWYLKKIDPHTLETLEHYHLEVFDFGTSDPNPEGLTVAYGKLFISSDPHAKIGWLDLDNIQNDTVPFIHKCTLPGDGEEPEALAFDGTNILYANQSRHRIYAIGRYSDTVLTNSYIDCLDSRPPEVTFMAPEATCAGTEAELRWPVDDLFWVNDPCTLHLFGCGIDEVYTPRDTHFTWTVPSAVCSSLTGIISVRDSFCNWGRDTVHISISSNPTAEIIRPQPCGGITSCEDQNIIIHIWDTTGYNIVDSSIILEVNGDEYDISSPELTWNATDNSLTFQPLPANYWRNEESVDFELVYYSNTVGCPGEPVVCSFVVDLEAPAYEFRSPGNEEVVMTLQPELVFNITDNLSGITEDSVELTINDISYYLADFIWLPESDCEGEMIFRPQAIPIKYAPGDTLHISLSACDSPDYDYCPPNCSESTWILVVDPKAVCDVHPNPFTPNNDGVNEITVFDYPTMFSESAELHIYTVRNVEVWSETIGPVVCFEEYLKRDWDGRDKKGKKLPEGLYIYLIERNGKVICNGTVVLGK